jgi:hypothetical protein
MLKLKGASCFGKAPLDSSRVGEPESAQVVRAIRSARFLEGAAGKPGNQYIGHNRKRINCEFLTGNKVIIVRGGIYLYFSLAASLLRYSRRSLDENIFPRRTQL